MPINTEELSGYNHLSYFHSFNAWGQPVELPASGSWLLERPIAGQEYVDLMNAYPLFICQNPQGLAQDIVELAEMKNRVALMLVSDPFWKDSDLQVIAPLFPDLFKPFKEHYYIDCEKPWEISKHHQYYTRKALNQLEVFYIDQPQELLETWCLLYDYLIKRHQLSGIKTFSKESFIQQFNTPGLIAFGAKYQNTILAMHLWYQDYRRKIIYNHLAATNQEGYDKMAPYALHQVALEYFMSLNYRYIHLGSGAGLVHHPGDGLSFFKRGWCNQGAKTYLCGRILQPDIYQELCQGYPERNYFPAYRFGDF